MYEIFIICILIYFFVYLTMLAYTIYKLNKKVNKINNIISKDLFSLKKTFYKFKKYKIDKKDK